MLLLTLIIVCQAEFIIRFTLEDKPKYITEVLNPGLSKMCLTNPCDPVYMQPEIDRFHELAYDFFLQSWHLGIDPKLGMSVGSGVWHIMGKYVDSSRDTIHMVTYDPHDEHQFPALTCAELAYIDEQNLSILFDTRDKRRGRQMAREPVFYIL